MPTKKLLIPLILILCTFLSCTKEKETTPLRPNLMLLKEIKDLQGKTVSRLKYDAAGRITETENRNYYQRFNYNSNGQLVKQESAIDPSIFASSTINQNTEVMTAATAVISTYTLYAYNQTEQLISAKHYHKQNGLFVSKSRRSLEYNNNFISKVNTHDAHDKVTQFQTYAYDSKGNVKEESYYSNLGQSAGTAPQLIHTATFSYDTGNNPFIIFKSQGLPGLYTNPNNVITVNTTAYDSTPGIPKTNTSKKIYEYNSSNFPIKENNLYEYWYY